jgi:hypothetical protein
MRNLRGPATEHLVHEWADRLRSSGSAAQNQEDDGRCHCDICRNKEIQPSRSGSAAQNQDGEAIARFIEDEQRDRGDLDPDTVEVLLKRIRHTFPRFSGSAAQNQEERVYDCAYNNARYAQPCDRCPAARSPQDEDHEAARRAQIAALVERAERAEAVRDALADAIRGLDSYAASSQVAPLERSERAAAALAAWEETA